MPSMSRALLSAALLALVPRGAAQAEDAAACSACTAEGGSWQAGKCWTKDFPLQPCPLPDAPGVCCRTPECCATAGCREPAQKWLVSIWMPQLSCQRCCTETPEGCKYKEWTGTPQSKVQPWYNVNGIERGQTCAKAFGANSCPPCAQCDKRTEDELLRLVRPQGCVCTSRTPKPDACFFRGSCDCYCQRLAHGLTQCPQLGSQLAHGEVGSANAVPVLQL